MGKETSTEAVFYSEWIGRCDSSCNKDVLVKVRNACIMFAFSS